MLASPAHLYMPHLFTQASACPPSSVLCWYLLCFLSFLGFFCYMLHFSVTPFWLVCVHIFSFILIVLFFVNITICQFLSFKRCGPCGVAVMRYGCCAIIFGSTLTLPTSLFFTFYQACVLPLQTKASVKVRFRVYLLRLLRFYQANCTLVRRHALLLRHRCRMNNV